MAGATDTTYSADSSDSTLKGGEGSDNNLTISAGIFPNVEYVYGGGSTDTAANDNKVTIKNLTGKVIYVYGGFATAEAKNNTVNLLMNNLQISSNLAGGGGITVISGNTLNIAAKNITT